MSGLSEIEQMFPVCKQNIIRIQSATRITLADPGGGGVKEVRT
jgi:hypothetical protein